MSCRIIGRNIEYTFFDQLVEQLQIRGVLRIRGEYYPTAKNAQVAGFYEGLGFQPVGQCANMYEIALCDYQFNNLGYIGIDR